MTSTKVVTAPAAIRSRSRTAPPRRAAPGPRRRRTKARVARVPAAPGPVVVRGLVWAVVLVGASAVGPLALLVVLLPVATVAAVSGLRAAKGHAGPVRMVGIVFAPLVAALTVGLVSRQDSGVAVILIMAVCLFDATNFVTGTGEVGGVLGSVVGAVTVASFMVILAAVVPAPLAGDPVDALALFAVVLCPAGVLLGRRLTGQNRLPAFRRIDSLLLTSPAWVLVTAALLHR